MSAPSRHYPSLLSPDIRERLAALGIDAEDSTSAWLEAIRDGRFPLAGLRRAPLERRSRLVGTSGSPGARMVPIPIPLAVVLPERAQTVR
jgi:hypothetical protein